MHYVAILLLSFALSQTAAAGSYKVTLREFGFGRTACSEDMRQVAQRFAERSGAEILSSGCLAPNVGHIDATGQFTYAAPERIETMSSDVRAWRSDGYYSSTAECQAALASEREVFSRLTGLEPFVGYCYKANSVGAPRYRVRLDAVGTSTVKKYAEATSWSFAPADASQLVYDVTQMVESTGGEVVAAQVGRDLAGYQLEIDYYGTEEFHVHSNEILYWQSASDCALAANDLNRSWDDQVARSLFHCTASSSGKSRLLQVYLSLNILSGFDFDSETYATDYPSQSSCMSDTSRIRDALTRTGTRVLGLVCGQSKTGETWKMAVFSYDEESTGPRD